MDYESAIETTVTFNEARHEIESHDCAMNDFVADYGERDEYSGADVLGWLGY